EGVLANKQANVTVRFGVYDPAGTPQKIMAAKTEIVDSEPRLAFSRFWSWVQGWFLFPFDLSGTAQAGLLPGSVVRGQFSLTGLFRNTGRGRSRDVTGLAGSWHVLSPQRVYRAWHGRLVAEVDVEVQRENMLGELAPTLRTTMVRAERGVEWLRPDLPR